MLEVLASFWELSIRALTHCLGIPTTQLDDFKFWVQYAAATYCQPNYVAPEGTKPTCSVGNCPVVEAADTYIKYSFSKSVTYTYITHYLTPNNISQQQNHH